MYIYPKYIHIGKGTRISPDEKAAWHPDVDVYFQENAWLDKKVLSEWTENTLKKFAESNLLDKFLLLCDNLSCQVDPAHVEQVAKLGGTVFYGLADATDLWR